MYRLTECRAYLEGQRYSYWRCINPGQAQFTLIKRTRVPGIEAWIASQYQRIDCPNDTLPYWRLYQVVPADLDLSWFQ